MASIVKRKNGTYAVVYYSDEGRKRVQKWETYPTREEAMRRRAEVETEILDKTFIPTSKVTLKDFLEEYVGLYGEENWSLSTYTMNVALIDNYINPLLGDEQIQSINARTIDRFYKTLRNTQPVKSTMSKAGKNQGVRPSVIDNTHKLLRSAFNQAYRWDVIKSNPYDKVSRPQVKYKKREMWDVPTIQRALNECDDSRLYVAINLAFACSLRMGEILGLLWENVKISDEDIANDNASIYIDKELQRASLKAIKTLREKDIIRIFPTFKPKAKTRMILKTPKTESSIRRVWLPKTLALMLKEYKRAQEGMKMLLGEEYNDLGFVICQTDGNPCEDRYIHKAFARLKENSNLPNVVFHSLRHSSTTYKLKLNKGDIKATQGDTGHAQADMVTKVYAHILDEDRKLNAAKMEAAFYTRQTCEDLKNVQPKEASTPPEHNDVTERLKNISPDMLAILSEILKRI